MPAPTAPAMLPRQDPANGIVVMGYELIGTQDDEPVLDSTSVASQQAASSIPASNSNPSISAPTPSPTSSPASEQNQSPGGSSGSGSTAIIAGSVVGGLAVIAFAGVAILYILKRSKRHPAGTPVPSSDGDSMNPYGTPEMTRNGYPEAQAYTYTATKYGHAINGGELDGQHGTAELGGIPLHEAEGRR
ncbi:hypothetical protein J4E91_004666 [Alternaria rosae]|nr:hypothetical protein J4E91_004666 [Alternaria rosae]